ncbi:hypothetical protein PV326_001248 [Microctonus aethiopoides]|nr:hypothetical protein PV326_001248 [Microctonus aethiopoides]
MCLSYVILHPDHEATHTGKASFVSGEYTDTKPYSTWDCLFSSKPLRVLVCNVCGYLGCSPTVPEAVPLDHPSASHTPMFDAYCSHSLQCASIDLYHKIFPFHDPLGYIGRGSKRPEPRFRRRKRQRYGYSAVS